MSIGMDSRKRSKCLLLVPGAWEENNPTEEAELIEPASCSGETFVTKAAQNIG